MDEIKKLSYIFTKKQKIESIGILILIIIGSGLELLGISTITPFINSILEPETLANEHPYSDIYNIMGLTDSQQLIYVMVVILIAVYILKNVYLIFMYKQQYKYIYSNMRILSTKMMRCYLDQPYSFHTKKNTSELLRNINQDTADFFGTIQALVQLATEGLTVIALTVYLLMTDISITITICVILGILIFLVMRVYRDKLQKMGSNNRYYEAEVNKWVQQAFGGIKEVKVLNKEDYFFNNYDKAYQGRVKSEYTYHTMIAIPKPILETCCIVALLVSILIKLLTGTKASLIVPIASVFAVASARLLPSFNRLTEYMGTITYQKPSIDAIYAELKEIELLNRKYKEPEKDKTVAKLKFEHSITLSNVSFKYPDSKKMILNDINMTIEKNTSVAFVGQSGAGKTTLADLILGVLTPTNGKIFCDGINIFDNLDSWHKTVGYIPQNIYLLDDTIKNNIAFGIDEKEIDQTRLIKACERAQLSNFISELPEGLNTQVGERGVRLSGGQRQRIGIARALYNEPDFLILDEATSALDNETESAVMESIDALHGEMTLLIIAHRLSTIRNCDVTYQIGKENAKLIDNPANS